MSASESFVVIVPVKPPARGKSRLATLPDDQRRDLAAAFALDTVAACLAARSVRAVLVPTDDHRFAAELRAAGCEVMPDGASDDLNAALVQAAAEVRRRWPGARPVVVCADLPCLTPDDLDAVLASVPEGSPAFVPDLGASGTTLYTAPSGSFDPSFGFRSAAAHAEAGALELQAPVGVRRDVDTEEDLLAALALGAGRHTARVAGAA
jgi:2-phospho-L-lactate guanylyltransferase